MGNVYHVEVLIANLISVYRPGLFPGKGLAERGARMADPLSNDTMLAALKDAGLRLVEYGSWRTHERDDETGQPYGPVHGIMIHHTASSGTDGSVSLCHRGRADLPGPLCHVVIPKDGRVFLISNGRANHAGLGDGDVLRAVQAEKALPAPNENNTDGNDRFYGCEAVNLGNGSDPWPEAQVDAIARWAAAICRKHGWSAKSVIGHKEWTNQKIDPRPAPGGADISMPALRARIQRLIDGKQTATGEDDVPDFVGMSCTKPKELTDSWSAIAWDREHVDQVGNHKEDWQRVITGPAKYTGTVYVKADQLAGSTDQLLVRVVEVDGKVKNSHPVGEHTDTPGKEYYAFPITGQLPKDRHLVVQVKKNGVPGIEVTANIKLLVWK